MTYLQALSFAIEEVCDNHKNVVDEGVEMIQTLEQLEDDLIRLLENDLTPEDFLRALMRQTSSIL